MKAKKYEVRQCSYYQADETWNAEHIQSFRTIEEAQPAYEACKCFAGMEKFLIDIETGETLKDSLTYDVVFNDETDSNNKGFALSYEECVAYVERNNGTNESYFPDYKNGTVSVVCNETGETVFETNVIKDKCYCDFVNDSFEIKLSRECVSQCYHSGDCQKDCDMWAENMDIKRQFSKIGNEHLISHILGMGTFNKKDLRKWKRKDLVSHVLWNLCSYISDSEEYNNN